MPRAATNGKRAEAHQTKSPSSVGPKASIPSCYPGINHFDGHENKVPNLRSRAYGDTNHRDADSVDGMITMFITNQKGNGRIRQMLYASIHTHMAFEYVCAPRWNLHGLIIYS